ncbi:hypothetical protein ONE63_007828 [Megalurothrips usitatus]|uniref:SAM-dependent MTase RsmB/NOP-type domain-containing protein n=1 Tax=Megalurothrips usitatus TaxID=439358 RepID=A0AAV7XRD9_9NEOP|nr:hypothetical protein ONE63_007828 [Megalurothrips usitatus]
MSESAKKPHSKARVPRLYKCAGKAVKEVRLHGANFKGLLYDLKHTNTKGLFALVNETLRHESELDALIRETGILVKEPRLDPWVTRVLMIELLWRNRPLAGPAIPLQIVRSYKSEFLSKQAGISTEVKKPVSITKGPRFVRINTIKISKEEIIDFFAQAGWHKLKNEDTGEGDRKYRHFLRTISSLSDDEFIEDAHIPNLLVFPRSLEFHNLDYYWDGSLLLQDKASCMPALLLNAPPGSTVLDMCAAPGMKTTHIAAILNNVGTIYAIEKNAERFNSLTKIVSQAEASCVKPLLGDSFKYSDKEIPGVEYILVDPSCSGSGMRLRTEIFNETAEKSKQRLETLASFQCDLLQHAMTNFPKVKRIVYSTCSIHPEENEAVVEKVLKHTLNFRPIIPDRGVEWMSRGSSEYDHGDFGFYSKPEIDMTSGFFLAVFERTEHDYVPGKMLQEICSTEAPVRSKRRKKAMPHISDTNLRNLEKYGNDIVDSENNLKLLSDTNDENLELQVDLIPKKKSKKKKSRKDESEPVLEDARETSSKRRKSKFSEEKGEDCTTDVPVKEKKKKLVEDAGMVDIESDYVSASKTDVDSSPRKEKKKKKKSLQL